MKLKPLLLWLATLIAVGLLSFFSDTFLLFSHQLTNLFASGRSPVRVYLFIAYCALFLISGFLHSKKGRIEKAFPIPERLSVLFMILIFALGIGTFFWFTNEYGILATQDDFFILLADKEITSIQFIHNQFGKAAVALFVFPFTNVLQNADPGISLLQFFPTWYPYVYALLAISLTASFFVVYLQKIRHEKKPYLFTLVFALATFCIIKNSIDGGLIGENAMVAIVFYLVLLCHSASSRLRTASTGLLAAILIYLLVFWSGKFSNEQQFVSNLHTALVIASVFAALTYGLYGASKRLLMLLVAAAVILVSNWMYIKIEPQIAYRNLVLSENLSVIGTLKESDNEHFEKLFSVGDLTYLMYKPKNGESFTVKEVVRSFSILDNYRPISTGKTCEKNARIYSLFTILTHDPLSSLYVGNDFYSLTFKEEERRENGWYSYEATYQALSCLTRDLNLMQEALREAGATRFVLYNLR